MFTAMLDGIKEETVSLLFHVQVQVVPAEPAPAAEPEPVTAPQTAVEAPAPAPEPDPEATAALPAVFRGAAPAELSYSGPAEDAPPPVAARRATGTRARPPRRARHRATGPCPCGSGRKYKQCHGSPTAARP
jgi:preprotein translocase subunit SecA